VFLEICIQIHSMVFALSRQINKQKECENNNLLCADNEVFVKYQTQGGGLTPTPCVRPWVSVADKLFNMGLRWCLH